MERILCVAGDPGEQTLACIGTAHPALLLFAIQRQGKHAEFVRPEHGIETSPAVRRLPTKPVGKVFVPKVGSNGCNAILGRIDVGLHLAERNGTYGQTSIAIEDGVARILPSLLHQSVIGLARVFHKPVMVLIAVDIDPFKRSENVWPDLPQKFRI